MFFNYGQFSISAVQGFVTSMVLFMIPMGEKQIMIFYVLIYAHIVTDCIAQGPTMTRRMSGAWFSLTTVSSAPWSPPSS